MRLTFTIPIEELNYYYTLLPGNSTSQIIDHYGVVYLAIYKVHDHRYDLAGFFYQSRCLIVPRSYTTKTKLHGAIQKLLQKHL